MNPLPEDFKEFLKLLNKHDVKYVLIGGYAVAYHGFIRATNDMDVWIELSKDNAEKTRKALIEFGLDGKNISTEIFLKEKQVIRMGVPPLRIEILTTISGVVFRECFNNRIVEMIDDIPVNFMNLENLKQNKKASGRLKDLNDLENLS